jgi:hypothetical protein
MEMNLREIWWEGLDWIHTAQYRDKWGVLVIAVINLGLPKCGKLLGLSE